VERCLRRPRGCLAGRCRAAGIWFCPSSPAIKIAACSAAWQARGPRARTAAQAAKARESVPAPTAIRLFSGAGLWWRIAPDGLYLAGSPAALRGAQLRPKGRLAAAGAIDCPCQDLDQDDNGNRLCGMSWEQQTGRPVITTTRMRPQIASRKRSDIRCAKNLNCCEAGLKSTEPKTNQRAVGSWMTALNQGFWTGRMPQPPRA